MQVYYLSYRERVDMKIGTVREIKNHEYRVGLTPNCAGTYIRHGHKVYIEAGAGLGAGFTDAEYMAMGADILPDAAAVYANSAMIVKVKEPMESEYGYLRENLIIYTFLHLAAEEPLTKAMLEKKVKGVAYETIEDHAGGLPCLRPMSEIAGRLSIQEGAKYLEKPFGGRGVLLGGVPGVEKGVVTVIGGGVVGTNACKVARGFGARVTVLDLNLERLVYLDDVFDGTVRTLFSTKGNLDACLAESDLVIGAVLVPGASAPKVITRRHLKLMKKGAVIVDVAVDQGGCCETTRPTTHEDPVYEVDGVMHYCVTNMPGAVPRTSTLALTNTTLSYGLEIADKGLEQACIDDPLLAKGVNTYGGACTYEAVAVALGLKYVPLDKAMKL
jgi:alanine dehydrogenase